MGPPHAAKAMPSQASKLEGSVSNPAPATICSTGTCGNAGPFFIGRKRALYPRFVPYVQGGTRRRSPKGRCLMACLKKRGEKYYAQYYVAGRQKRVGLDTDLPACQGEAPQGRICSFPWLSNAPADQDAHRRDSLRLRGVHLRRITPRGGAMVDRRRPRLGNRTARHDSRPRKDR